MPLHVSDGLQPCRELKAEATSLITEKQELNTTVSLLKARLDEGLARVQMSDRMLTEAHAQLDRKRQKKRQYKAKATKVQQLWQSVWYLALWTWHSLQNNACAIPYTIRHG
jgi:uncharacterized coiled-coil DUF342 family protein